MMDYNTRSLRSRTSASSGFSAGEYVIRQAFSEPIGVDVLMMENGIGNYIEKT
jgi:hypothetical protein